MTDNTAESYEAILARARAAAALKRLSGEVPEGTGQALDRLFLEVAPGGARAEADGLEAAVDMLGRYRFDASGTQRAAAAPGVRGRVSGLVKRVLEPVTSWQLRHLTDQLNAYHLAETELLRAVVQAAGRAPAEPEAPAQATPAKPEAPAKATPAKPEAPPEEPRPSPPEEPRPSPPEEPRP